MWKTLGWTPDGVEIVYRLHHFNDEASREQEHRLYEIGATVYRMVVEAGKATVNVRYRANATVGGRHPEFCFLPPQYAHAAWWNRIVARPQ